MDIRKLHGLDQAKKELAGRGKLDFASLGNESSTGSEILFGETLTIEESVRRILKDVRELGDVAVRKYAKLLDELNIESLEISPQDVADGADDVDQRLLQSLKFAAKRIEDYHKSSLPTSWLDADSGLGGSVIPLERVGVYAPGGTASYPSTVLMTVIPARVAGVQEVILCTPSTAPAVLAAARIAGVDRVFRIGGVQAVGAMAFGTETVPKVDMVCGPGNAYVTLAKKQVFGDVAIDGLYGPTETVLIADGSADPVHVAADLLAQAEHDPMASPILVTTDRKLIDIMPQELEHQLARLERKDIAITALSRGGCAVLVGSIDEAVELGNLIAPEHMCLLVKDPWMWVDKVKNAGGLFLGEYSPEVVGDYVAGPSHVMPTGGTSRFSSALGVHQFLRTMPVVGLKPEGFDELSEAVSVIARSEGLTAHAMAMEVRLSGKGSDGQ